MKSQIDNINPTYMPIKKTEAQIELDDVLYVVKRAVERLQVSEYLYDSLHGKRVATKLIMDLTSTCAYIMEISETFKDA